MTLRVRRGSQSFFSAYLTLLTKIIEFQSKKIKIEEGKVFAFAKQAFRK
jgi:hypothetical protein